MPPTAEAIISHSPTGMETKTGSRSSDIRRDIDPAAIAHDRQQASDPAGSWAAWMVWDGRREDN